MDVSQVTADANGDGRVRAISVRYPKLSPTDLITGAQNLFKSRLIACVPPTMMSFDSHAPRAANFIAVRPIVPSGRQSIGSTPCCLSLSRPSFMALSAAGECPCQSTTSPMTRSGFLDQLG